MKIETEWPILPAINARRHVDKNFTYFFLNAVDHYRWIFLRKPAEESWNSHPFVLKTGDSRQLRRDKLKISLQRLEGLCSNMAEVTFIWYPLTSYFAILYLLPSLPSRPLKFLRRSDWSRLCDCLIFFPHDVGMAEKYKERLKGTVLWYSQRK